MLKRIAAAILVLVALPVAFAAAATDDPFFATRERRTTRFSTSASTVPMASRSVVAGRC